MQYLKVYLQKTPNGIFRFLGNTGFRKMWKNMTPLTSQTEVYYFIVLVNYYHDMCTRCSHTLSPLTKIMPNKVKFKYTKIEQELFE